ncbi:hypothetical protein LSAT2_021686 [Lamellibrachia satsuma]|nr:hypothetical protein LSAT2_021686 [Lamellibrachia satsuma]
MAALSSCRAGEQFSCGDTDSCPPETFSHSPGQDRQTEGRQTDPLARCASDDDGETRWCHGKMFARNQERNSEWACFGKTLIVLELPSATTKEHA